MRSILSMMLGSFRLKKSTTMLDLTIDWKGPYALDQVIHNLTDSGDYPGYDGEDYGLYQIYGEHILGNSDALLYIGKAPKQTFSTRFKKHVRWLRREDSPVRVYVGRIYIPRRHSSADNWAKYEADIGIAESILIYKYSPHYNGRSVSKAPSLRPHGRVVLTHAGARHRLQEIDRAPDDL